MESKVLRVKLGVLSFVMLFFTVSSLFAQKGVLKGQVIDGKTQETMVGVSVAIKELPGTGTASDIDGNYEFSLPAGIYTVVASYISYVTFEITKVEIKSGVPTVLGIDMKESEQMLEEVVVVARVKMEAEKVLMIERQNAGKEIDRIKGFELEDCAEI